MCEEVCTYLNNIKSVSSDSKGFVSYFMQKGQPAIHKPIPAKPSSTKSVATNVSTVYIKPTIKTLSDETIKKFSQNTQKIYSLACKIHELNHTDIRALDKFMTDYNYAYLRHKIEELLGELSDYDFDRLNEELMEIDRKYKNQTDIIRIALESLRRFLEHQNFIFQSEEEESDNN